MCSLMYVTNWLINESCGVALLAALDVAGDIKSHCTYTLELVPTQDFWPWLCGANFPQNPSTFDQTENSTKVFTFPALTSGIIDRLQSHSKASFEYCTVLTYLPFEIQRKVGRAGNTMSFSTWFKKPPPYCETNRTSKCKRFSFSKVGYYHLPVIPRSQTIDGFHSDVIKLLSHNSEVLRILIYTRLKINKR